MSRRPKVLVRHGAAFVLGYEALALVSGSRLPTVTQLCVRHRWLSAAAVGGLIAHLIMYAPAITLPSDLDPD